MTNIWFSNFSKERTNKRTEIGKKITKVNTLYKEKEKTVDAVILPLSYDRSFYTHRATAILTLLCMWQQVNRLSVMCGWLLFTIFCANNLSCKLNVPSKVKRSNTRKVTEMSQKSRDKNIKIAVSTLYAWCWFACKSQL